VNPFVCVVLLAVLFTGCSSPQNSGVGTVDIARITSHWRKFSDYERQLRTESERIGASQVSEDQRRAQLDILHTKYEAQQNEITTRVRQAADRVAQRAGLRLVVTREFVGYGGRDVTGEVEAALGIVETPSPAPSQSSTPGRW
jgi:type IV pilus biogenesis protein CpaD/CtpE